MLRVMEVCSIWVMDPAVVLLSVREIVWRAFTSRVMFTFLREIFEVPEEEIVPLGSIISEGAVAGAYRASVRERRGASVSIMLWPDIESV